MLGWGIYTNSVGNKGQMKEVELDRLGLVSFCLPEPIYLQILKTVHCHHRTEVLSSSCPCGLCVMSSFPPVSEV